MMKEETVVDLLKKSDFIDVDIWVTGGWGVDALLGQQSRLHNDIDLFVQKKDRVVFTEMIRSNGYHEANIEETDTIVWRGTNDSIIDLHLFEFTEEGALCFQNKIYPADIFNGTGTIGGIRVRCMPAEAQVLYHQGYRQNEKDRHDVLLLCKTFGISIPEEYEKYE
jgi:lincosamide nucleotidyltransferase A/C/D/E